MAVALSYPGVYIEEVPSGVRTIVGVPTSITAFVGRAPRGATNQPVTCFGFGDFEREFGPLNPDYPLGYAVAQFFQNGGGQALVVRLYKAAPVDGAPPPPPAPATRPAVAVLVANGLRLRAASEGAWGNQIRARVDHDVSEEAAASVGHSAAELFNLTVRDGATGLVETHRNLTHLPNRARSADKVLARASTLVRTDGDLPAARPTPHANPAAGAPLDWTADAQSTRVADGARAADSAPLDAGAFAGDEDDKTGLRALAKADLFNLLVLPPDAPGAGTPQAILQDALTYCVERRAMLLVDAPPDWTVATIDPAAVGGLGLTGEAARNAALYFPRIEAPDPARRGVVESYGPSGAVAGIMARTDARRGVWKAPAGLDAAVNSIRGLTLTMDDRENGKLNPLGVNCLRTFPLTGTVVWGARTLRGADALTDEYKYVPIRRLALFIEESLYRGTQWVVFEPNDEPLWAQVRMNVGAFMHTLFRQGAFQGRTPQEAYFVRCDRDTNPQADVDRGVVNIHVGFAPLKPAEFVVIRLQQIAGAIAGG